MARTARKAAQAAALMFDNCQDWRRKVVDAATGRPALGGIVPASTKVVVERCGVPLHASSHRAAGRCIFCIDGVQFPENMPSDRPTTAAKARSNTEAQSALI